MDRRWSKARSVRLASDAHDLRMRAERAALPRGFLSAVTTRFCGRPCASMSAFNCPSARPSVVRRTLVFERRSLLRGMVLIMTISLNGPARTLRNVMPTPDRPLSSLTAFHARECPW